MRFAPNCFGCFGWVGSRVFRPPLSAASARRDANRKPTGQPQSAHRFFLTGSPVFSHDKNDSRPVSRFPHRRKTVIPINRSKTRTRNPTPQSNRNPPSYPVETPEPTPLTVSRECPLIPASSAGGNGEPDDPFHESFHDSQPVPMKTSRRPHRS